MGDVDHRRGGGFGGVETSLTARPLDAEEARSFLECAARFDTSGGLLTQDEATQGAVWMGLEQGGQLIGAYALSLTQHQRGGVLWMVAAAANVPGRDLSPHILSLVEQQAGQVGAQQVAVTTIRRGAIKKLLAHGYEVTGVTLRKRL